MKKYLLIACLILFVSVSGVTFVMSEKSEASGKQADYDSVLAKELGADDYGMRKYVMAFLKAGPTPSKDKETAQKLQAEHMENINRMAGERKLSVAGPFLDKGELRGVYVFNVETIEEAAELTKTDPLIQSGGLIMELHLFYCSAALMKVNEIHKRITK